MCLTFSSNLKGAASHWFYSPPLRSLCNFTEVSKASLTQYASRQEAKRNSHHLLSIKMRQGDSLKSYINFFRSQLTKISNCDEEVSALAFISGLQVTHPLYKHLLKYNIAKINKVLFRTPPYIQLEEARKASTIHSAKPGDGGGKSKSPHKTPDHAQDRRGQPAHKRQALPIPANTFRDYRSMERFTSLYKRGLQK